MLIPYRDSHQRISWPWMTAAIVLSNVLIHLAQSSANDAFLYRWGLIPWEISHFREMTGLPADYASGWLNGITPLTSLFLHAGWLHLLGNLIFFYVFADRMESVMGHRRFLLYYLMCGLGSSLVYVIMRPQSQLPLIGASGAIAGIMGGYALRFPLTWIYFWLPKWRFRLPSLLFMAGWLAWQIWGGYRASHGGASSVAWSTHLGGFAMGAVLGWFMTDAERLNIVKTRRLAGQGLFRPPHAGPD